MTRLHLGQFVRITGNIDFVGPQGSKTKHTNKTVFTKFYIQAARQCSPHNSIGYKWSRAKVYFIDIRNMNCMS
jgi:hypothetical protein